MNDSQCRDDRYLMTLRFNTALDPHHHDRSAPGKDISFGTGSEVKVRVTNRLLTPLTPDHLQSVALSVPGLHTRLHHDLAAVAGLFHCGRLQTYRLPNTVSEGECWEPGEDSSPPKPSVMNDREAVRGAHWSGAGSLREVGPSDDSDVQSQKSDADEYRTCSSPDTALSEAAESGGFHSACDDLPSPRRPGKDDDEYAHVEFKGQRYLRLLTPVKAREGDVEASWAITDFTEAREELVFSLWLDLVRPCPVVPHWMRDLEDETM